jgi:isoamylase
MTATTPWPGKPYPLGATYDGQGTNFAIFSEHAEAVDLLLFDSANEGEATDVIPIHEKTAYVWHVYLQDIKPNQLYAYRAHGSFEPQRGHRFNSYKVLLDPYAKAIAGTLVWNEALFGYQIGDTAEDLSYDDRDSSSFLPKCVVLDPSFDWEDVCPPRIPWSETVIYEVHVKGFTVLHPGIEESMRGTYAGIANPEVIEYLKNLNVTAVELLPVHHHVNEKILIDRGLTNYWGYNTIGYFAPDSRYSSSGFQGEQVREFKEMVKTLHKSGIEVILDVVYNHTAEGNHHGPTICFRGIDNVSYYYLSPEDPRFYMDFTGTGNSPRMSHPRVTQLIMDSLRYWILEMHVDGFRFDLASTLARELYDVDQLSAFFDIIQQDPVISQVKLIAEPWDLGEGGYQVGNFTPLWAEWNGKYRDTIRRFWRGDKCQVRDLGYRLTGSSDLYQDDGRRPYASINFITSHDGFTLSDLVSYDEKHNEANKENNKDGINENLSWNCGVEGPSDDPGINDLRERQKRNFLATLFLSQGVPMLHGGDEIGRTQYGNNNSYCQDNEMNWHEWTLDDSAEQLLEFTRRLIHIRCEHPVLRRRKFFQGQKLCGSDVKDITWLRPDGSEMNEEDWEQDFVRTIGLRLAGDAINEYNDKGERISDDTFLVILNALDEKIVFHLPPSIPRWNVLVNTFGPDIDLEEVLEEIEDQIEVGSRSLLLLQQK